MFFHSSSLEWTPSVGHCGQVFYPIDVERSVSSSAASFFQVVTFDRAMCVPVVLDDRQTYFARGAHGTLEVLDLLIASRSGAPVNAVGKAGDHHVAHGQAAGLELVDSGLQIGLLPGHLGTAHEHIVHPDLLDLPHRFISDLATADGSADLGRVGPFLGHPGTVWALVLGSVQRRQQAIPRRRVKPPTAQQSNRFPSSGLFSKNQNS